MNDWKDQLSLVYSTNKEVQNSIDNPQVEKVDTLAPGLQDLRIALDKRNRKGKQVTIVADFKGSSEDLQLLASQLKKKLGVGGAAKDGEIIIQGDFRAQINSILTQLGYKSRVI